MDRQLLVFNSRDEMLRIDSRCLVVLLQFGNTYLAEQVSLGRERQNVTDFNEMI